MIHGDPVGTDLAEIAAFTYNNPSDFYEIMDMLDKRLNDKAKIGGMC